jgi:AcrR family transcriptional regulator
MDETDGVNTPLKATFINALVSAMPIFRSPQGAVGGRLGLILTANCAFRATMGVMANQIGLRERRRRETSADIRGAALRLAQDRGWDKVTIDEICVEAGISTRTFFNYFPNKESAIAYGPPEIPAELAEDFVAAGPAPYSVVLAELITLAAHHLRDEPPSRDQAVCMLELVKTTPAVLAAFLADLERFQNHLTDIVARRQMVGADEEIPALISALALTAVRSGIERWSSSEPKDPDDTPMLYIERAAALVNSIFTK